MDVYLPVSMSGITIQACGPPADDRQWIVMGRLKPGVAIAQARSSISLIVSRLANEYPAAKRHQRAGISSGSPTCAVANNLIVVVSGLSSPRHGRAALACVTCRQYPAGPDHCS